MAKKTKLPKDTNQKAKKIVDLVTNESKSNGDSGKNPAAVELGRKGGLKGGRARANILSSKRKSEIARKAARARWGYKGKD